MTRPPMSREEAERTMGPFSIYAVCITMRVEVRIGYGRPCDVFVKDLNIRVACVLRFNATDHIRRFINVHEVLSVIPAAVLCAYCVDSFVRNARQGRISVCFRTLCVNTLSQNESAVKPLMTKFVDITVGIGKGGLLCKSPCLTDGKTSVGHYTLYRLYTGSRRYYVVG